MLVKSVLYVISKWKKDENLHKLVSNFFQKCLERIYLCSQG